MSFLATTRFILTPAISKKMRMFSNGPSGWDKDSGGSGSIREAGGAFGKMEAAREDEFFYNKQREQLQKIKDHLEKEIYFHEEQIKRHEEAIRRHKEHMDGMSHSHN